MTNDKENFTYLIYDIESIVDKKLLRRVLYAGEGLSDEAAYERHVAELASEQKSFVNPAFHAPISLAVMAVGRDFRITRLGHLGGERSQRTTESIVRDFWTLYNERPKLRLVDFHGKAYDLRLMELWAFQLGITIRESHFDKFGPRYRYNLTEHLDLNEFITNAQSLRLQGGLNMLAKRLGKPGKLSTKGDMVQSLFEAGDLFRIDDYCLCDVMDTYFVFLRTQVMLGHLDLSKEAVLWAETTELMKKKQQEQGYFTDYLDALENPIE